MPAIKESVVSSCRASLYRAQSVSFAWVWDDTRKPTNWCAQRNPTLFNVSQRSPSLTQIFENKERIFIATCKNKKSPQIVEPRPSMCWTNFPAGKHKASPLNILVHLHIYVQRGKEFSLRFSSRVDSSSKQSEAHSWLHNACQRFAPSATVWPKFEWGVLGFFWEGWGGIRGSGFTPTESPPQYI